MNLNQVGLVTDVMGVLILFKYGLPSEYSQNPSGFLLMVNDRPEEDIESEKMKNQFVKRMAYD